MRALLLRTTSLLSRARASLQRWGWRQARFLPRSWIALPPLGGWRERLLQMKRDGVYNQDGVCGVPPAWCIVGETTCAETGVPISNATPLVEGGRDFSHFGVRCARCGVALHHSVANIALPIDPGACWPCRPAIRAVLNGD